MKQLSVGEAAVQLGVSPSLVYGLCAQKRIRHERHGLGRGKIVIPEDALDEYRRQRTVQVEEGTAEAAPSLTHINLHE
jgi:excisionase family DNA binding protein